MQHWMAPFYVTLGQVASPGLLESTIKQASGTAFPAQTRDEEPGLPKAICIRVILPRAGLMGLPVRTYMRVVSRQTLSQEQEEAWG